MDFSLNDEQLALRSAVRGLLADHLPAERVRAVMADSGVDENAWGLLCAEMGLAGLLVPDELGGAGATFVEAGVVLRELGANVAPLPFLPTTVAAAVLAHVAEAPGGRGTDTAGRAAKRIASKAAAAAVALDARLRISEDGPAGHRLDGQAEHVVDGQFAAFFVVVDAAPGAGGRAFLVEAGTGVDLLPRMTLDQTRRQATVRFDGAAATELVADGFDPGARARDLFAVALAAESVGAAGAVLGRTVEYLKVREQFGRPIGSFQSLQHRCADLLAAVEAAESAVVHAEWAAAYELAELPVLAPLAAATAVEAFLRVAGDSIQLHGGIGFTWEHDAHLYFKRAKANELLLGGVQANRRLAANRAGVLP